MTEILASDDIWLLYIAFGSGIAIAVHAIFFKTKVAKATISAYYVYDPKRKNITTVKNTANGERKHVIDIKTRTIHEVRQTA